MDTVKAVRDLERMGATEAESYLQNSVETVLSVRGDGWNKRKKKDISIGLRSLVGKQKGFAAGTLPMCSLEEIEKACFMLSRRTAPDPSWEHLPFPKPKREPEGIYDRGLALLSEEELMDEVQAAVNAARIAGVTPDLTMITRVESVAVANTHGVEGSYQSTKVDITFSCVHRENEAFWEWHSRTFPEDLKTIAEKTAEKALKSEKCSKINLNFSGDAIFLQDSFSFIFVPCIKWTVGAESIYSKRSQFADKQGEVVASPLVTITDSGVLPSGVRSAPFDGEGNPMQETGLIEKGVFGKCIHSEYTANKYGGVSTGNAMRSATAEPALDFTNLILKVGDSSLDALIKKVDEGVVVKDFSGDVDPSSGYFNGRAHGSYIKKGEILNHLKLFLVRGNAFECLRNVKGVGKEQECSYDGVYAVPLLASGVMVMTSLT